MIIIITIIITQEQQLDRLFALALRILCCHPVRWAFARDFHFYLYSLRSCCCVIVAMYRIRSWKNLKIYAHNPNRRTLYADHRLNICVALNHKCRRFFGNVRIHCCQWIFYAHNHHRMRCVGHLLSRSTCDDRNSWKYLRNGDYGPSTVKYGGIDRNTVMNDVNMHNNPSSQTNGG